MKTWEQFKGDINSMNHFDKKLLEYKANQLVTLIQKRKELKITQTKLAEDIGVTQVTMSRIETSAEIPSLDLLYKISIYLENEESKRKGS